MVGKVGLRRGATSLPAVAAILLITAQTCLGSEVQVKEEGRAMELKSSAFENNQDIPRKYTCDGADGSPPLVWNNPPDGARAFALISDDPDAPVGTWVQP
jgi:phosphatidylethanolamine-binding protein (PEBP) family uncharacterized protein